MDKKPEHKTEKTTRTPRKPKVDIEKLAQARAEEILKEREQAKAVEQSIYPAGPTITPIVVPVVEPAPEHHTPIEDVEEKAIGIWGKVKAWKWFWLVVGGVALIMVVLGYQWVNKKVIDAGIQKTEVKETKAEAKITQSDSTAKHSDILKPEERLLLDSLRDALQRANESSQKWQDYEKKKYQ